MSDEKRKKIEELYREYVELKEKIFGESMFAVIEDEEVKARYESLFGFFFPSFRTKNWVNPMGVIK